MSSALPLSAHPTGRCTDRNLVARHAATFGLMVLHGQDIALARDIGAAMIGADLASAETLTRCQQTAEAVVFGYREADVLTGMMALLPLNGAGLRQLEAASFDARDPSLDLVSRPGEAPACYYAWGIAATTKDAARALIKASASLHTHLFWAIPSYTRAATEDGLRLMSSFGYRPYTKVDPQLIVALAPGAPKVSTP